LRGRCESVDRGTIIDNGSNERLVQGQEGFWIAALGRMSQNLESVRGSKTFRFDTFNTSDPGVVRLEEKPQKFHKV